MLHVLMNHPILAVLLSYTAPSEGRNFEEYSMRPLGALPFVEINGLSVYIIEFSSSPTLTIINCLADVVLGSLTKHIRNHTTKIRTSYSTLGRSMLAEI